MYASTSCSHGTAASGHYSSNGREKKCLHPVSECDLVDIVYTVPAFKIKNINAPFFNIILISFLTEKMKSYWLLEVHDKVQTQVPKLFHFSQHAE